MKIFKEILSKNIKIVSYIFYVLGIITQNFKGLVMIKFYRNLHIYLSLFFLPLAFMYALTGVSYIFGYDKDTHAKINHYPIDFSIQKGEEKEAILSFLKENNLPLPSKRVEYTKKGEVELGGILYTAKLHTKGNGAQEIVTKKRSFLGVLIMLHKTKGLWYFDVLTVGFGITLILLYISGLMMTLFHSKSKRVSQYVTILLGIVVSVLVGYVSVL